MDDAELVRRLRGGINGMRITVLGNVQHGEACLEAADRIEALIAERDRQYDENVHRIAEQARVEAERDAARDAALEEAASKVERDQWPTFGDAHRIAAAIRAMKGKSHE